MVVWLKSQGLKKSYKVSGKVSEQKSDKATEEMKDFK